MKVRIPVYLVLTLAGMFLMQPVLEPAVKKAFFKEGLVESAQLPAGVLYAVNGKGTLAAVIDQGGTVQFLNLPGLDRVAGYGIGADWANGLSLDDSSPPAAFFAPGGDTLVVNGGKAFFVLHPGRGLEASFHSSQLGETAEYNLGAVLAGENAERVLLFRQAGLGWNCMSLDRSGSSYAQGHRWSLSQGVRSIVLDQSGGYCAISGNDGSAVIYELRYLNQYDKYPAGSDKRLLGYGNTEDPSPGFIFGSAEGLTLVDCDMLGEEPVPLSSWPQPDYEPSTFAVQATRRAYVLHRDFSTYASSRGRFYLVRPGKEAVTVELADYPEMSARARYVASAFYPDANGTIEGCAIALDESYANPRLVSFSMSGLEARSREAFQALVHKRLIPGLAAAWAALIALIELAAFFLRRGRKSHGTATARAGRAYATSGPPAQTTAPAATHGAQDRHFRLVCPRCGWENKLERLNDDLEIYLTLIDRGSSVPVQAQECPSCHARSSLAQWHAATKSRHGSIWCP